MTSRVRIYTVREANALIPYLEVAFSELDGVRGRLRKVKGRLDLLEMLWGEEIQSESNPDRKEYEHYVAELHRAKEEYEAIGRRVAEREVLLKSVESGLVDFYGVIDSYLVFLCWERGEKEVEYYHELEAGYAGRQPIAPQYKLT